MHGWRIYSIIVSKFYSGVEGTLKQPIYRLTVSASKRHDLKIPKHKIELNALSSSYYVTYLSSFPWEGSTKLSWLLDKMTTKNECIRYN